MRSVSVPDPIVPDAQPCGLVSRPAASSPAPAVQDPPASTDAPAQAASEPADTDPDYKADRNCSPKRIQERDSRVPNAPSAPCGALRSPSPSRLLTPARGLVDPPRLACVKPDPESFPYGTADPGYVEALTAFKVTLATLNQERAAGPSSSARPARRTNRGG
jgi:hypothetical protein